MPDTPGSWEARVGCVAAAVGWVEGAGASPSVLASRWAAASSASAFAAGASVVVVASREGEVAPSVAAARVGERLGGGLLVSVVLVARPIPEACARPRNPSLATEK